MPAPANSNPASSSAADGGGQPDTSSSLAGKSVAESAGSEGKTPEDPAGQSSSQPQLLPSPAATAEPRPAPGKFNLKGALLQSFEFTMFNHAWRVAWDPSLRYQLAHKPFFHDWFVSYKGYNLTRWSDGDDFLVNDVGHPLQGAVFSRIYLQNDPRSWVSIGKNRNYWIPLLKSMAWSAAWEVQWKVGPFSETSLGNAGGWTYVNGCGTALSCLNNPKYPSAPTNNTGLTDWIVTPVIGMLWVMGEDTLEKYIVVPIARNHRIFGGRILRSCLEPSKDFAAVFAGKFPWMLPNAENNFVVSTKPKPAKVKPAKDAFQHWEMGTQYTYISLPALTTSCAKPCREGFSGMGTSFDYNFTRGFAFDSSFNFLPAQQGSQAMLQGLFGVRMGQRFQHFGVFGKVRPGFIYYNKALPGGGDPNPNSLSRFAWDFGGIVEVYPRRESRSTIRFDVGTTLVRYLTDHTDPRLSQIGNLLSPQYIVTQGNFQFSTGYTYRF